MQHIKTIIYLVICFFIGVGVTRVITGFKGFHGKTADAFETPRVGIGNAPRLRGFCLPLNKGTAELIWKVPTARLHATAVSVSYTSGGPAAKHLQETVAAAHRQKLDVILVPGGGFSRTNSYGVPLEQVAREAEAAKVNALCLSFLNAEPDLAYWKKQAEAVKKIYKGKIILAGTAEAVAAVDSAEGFDYVAAIGPIDLPRRLSGAADDVDLAAMRVFWDCSLDSLESQAKKLGVPLMLLNMQVPVTIQGKMPPLDGKEHGAANPELQRTAYEALLMQTKGRESIEALFVPWTTGGGVSEDVAVNRFPELLEKVESLWSSSSPVPPSASATSTEPGFDFDLPLPDLQ